MIKALKSFLGRKYRANCWFCSQDQEIEAQRADWWKCKFCDQYNGFAEDGDYRYPVPEMFRDGDEASHSLLDFAQTYPHRVVHYSDSLDAYRDCPFCAECSNNLSLKVRQAAKFTPVNPDNYEAELRSYRVKLEQQYALCPQCEKRAEAEIARKNALLRRQLRQNGTEWHGRHGSLSCFQNNGATQPPNSRGPEQCRHQLTWNRPSTQRWTSQTSVSGGLIYILLALRILSNVYIVIDKLELAFAASESLTSIPKSKPITAPNERFAERQERSALFLSSVSVMIATELALQRLRPVLFDGKSFLCVLLTNVIVSLLDPLSTKLKNLIHLISAITLLSSVLVVVPVRWA